MSTSKHEPIEQFECFRIFEEVSQWAWDRVTGWKKFEQTTLGSQLVTSLDSIGANMVEGDGRFTHADGLRFFVIARASAREARLWLVRAKTRKLLTDAEVTKAIAELEKATRLLNLLINARKNSAYAVKENLTPYGSFHEISPLEAN